VRRPPHRRAGVGRSEVDTDRRPAALRGTHLHKAEAAGRRSSFFLFLNFGRGKF
jgi:hypothetical protein